MKIIENFKKYLISDDHDHSIFFVDDDNNNKRNLRKISEILTDIALNIYDIYKDINLFIKIIIWFFILILNSFNILYYIIIPILNLDIEIIKYIKPNEDIYIILENLSQKKMIYTLKCMIVTIFCYALFLIPSFLAGYINHPKAALIFDYLYGLSVVLYNMFLGTSVLVGTLSVLLITSIVLAAIICLSPFKYKKHISHETLTLIVIMFGFLFIFIIFFFCASIFWQILCDSINELDILKAQSELEGKPMTLLDQIRFVLFYILENDFRVGFDFINIDIIKNASNITTIHRSEQLKNGTATSAENVFVLPLCDEKYLYFTQHKRVLNLKVTFSNTLYALFGTLITFIIYLKMLKSIKYYSLYGLLLIFYLLVLFTSFTDGFNIMIMYYYDPHATWGGSKYSEAYENEIFLKIHPILIEKFIHNYDFYQNSKSLRNNFYFWYYIINKFLYYFFEILIFISKIAVDDSINDILYN